MIPRQVVIDGVVFVPEVARRPEQDEPSQDPGPSDADEIRVCDCPPGICMAVGEIWWPRGVVTCVTPGVS